MGACGDRCLPAPSVGSPGPTKLRVGRPDHQPQDDGDVLGAEGLNGATECRVAASSGQRDKAIGAPPGSVTLGLSVQPEARTTARMSVEE